MDTKRRKKGGKEEERKAMEKKRRDNSSVAATSFLYDILMEKYSIMVRKLEGSYLLTAWKGIMESELRRVYAGFMGHEKSKSWYNKVYKTSGKCIFPCRIEYNFEDTY